MSSWGEWYESVWDALVKKVLSIEDFKEETVFYGEKFPPNQYPSAYVCPSQAQGAPVTFRETDWLPTFEIGVVVRDPDVKKGILTAIKLIGKIIDVINADRQLENTVQNTECVAMVPYWRGLGRGTESHWIGLIVRCERKR